MAVNEGGAIKSRACVLACTVQRREGRRSSHCAAAIVWRKGEKRERERAQINLLSGARGERGEDGRCGGSDGRDGPLASRADDEDGDDDGAR